MADLPPAPVPGSFAKIQHIVVLMLENRSFDHLFGRLNALNPRIAGLTGSESNYDDPNAPQPGQLRTVSVADRFDMPFDPPHEFPDVQVQLFGPAADQPGRWNPPVVPAPMSGFVFRTLAAVPNLYPEDAARVMSGFAPEQIPVLSALAQQFAICNSWYSSLPGPTWPNRFFVHAATSGGLVRSPSELQVIAGFSFKNGTIYDRLGKSGWRIYHDGLPQTIGISDLRWNYLKQVDSPFDSNFRPMAEFRADLAAGDLPQYTFIEPNYDTGNNYVGGNSMHPLNDIRNGEGLVKLVYESLRGSSFWESSMLVITFDEHGGFYDHVSPPGSVATGDDHRYAEPEQPFAFDRLGVRVPALVISPYTAPRTVLGSGLAGDSLWFDHSSVPATVAKRFGLQTLTARDAQASTLDAALNLADPRLGSGDAPVDLPDAAPAPAVTAALAPPPPASAAGGSSPISDNQRTFLALALACDLEMTPVAAHPALRQRYGEIQGQAEAADYIKEVSSKIRPTTQ